MEQQQQQQQHPRLLQLGVNLVMLRVKDLLVGGLLLHHGVEELGQSLV